MLVTSLGLDFTSWVERAHKQTNTHIQTSKQTGKQTKRTYGAARPVRKLTAHASFFSSDSVCITITRRNVFGNVLPQNDISKLVIVVLPNLRVRKV